MTTVSNNAELMSALSSAQGGERIELAGGDYGSLDIRGVTFSSDVTIVSADPTNPAVFRNLMVRNALHLVFDGILFDYVFKAGDPIAFLPFEVRKSSFITIRNSIFDGAPVIEGRYGRGIGLIIGDSDHTVIDNNEFFHWWKSFVVGQSTDTFVRGNNAHSGSHDAFNFIGVDGLLIEGNWFHDFDAPPDWGHRDYIQFWTVLNKAPAQNVTIRGNFFDGGIGTQSQNIFMRNGIVDTGQGGFEEYAYRNILIEDNVIYGAGAHGITVGETDGLVIRDNTILFDQHLADGVQVAPQMRLKTDSVNVTVQRNILHYDVPASPGWIVGQNLKVQISDYWALFVDALIRAPILDDLRALPDTVIMTDDLGAEMTRFDLPFEVGPAPGSALDPIPEPDPLPEPDPEPIPDPEDAQMQLSDLVVNLIDATDDTVVQRLLGGDFLSVEFMATGDATIAVGLMPGITIGSMRLTLGAINQTENTAPYALFGDAAGDFNPGLVLTEGEHTLRIEVFSKRLLAGDLLGDFTVDFTVGEVPVVEVPEWQEAIDDLQAQIDALLGVLDARLNTPVTVWGA